MARLQDQFATLSVTARAAAPVGQMEEVDPLDAYMASLGPVDTSDAGVPRVAAAPRGRELQERRQAGGGIFLSQSSAAAVQPPPHPATAAGGASSAVVRNRRYVRLQAMIAEGHGFFSDEQMEERAPELFHAMLGRHLDAATTYSWSASSTCLAPAPDRTDSIQTAMDDAYVAARRANVIPDAASAGCSERSGVRWGSISGESEQPRMDALGTHATAPLRLESVPVQLPVAGEPATTRCSAAEPVSAAEASHRLTHGLSEMMISAMMCQKQRERRHAAEARVGYDASVFAEDDCDDGRSVADRRAALLRVMGERFLSGQESAHFDYTAVDADANLDVSREAELDAEDAYFTAAGGAAELDSGGGAPGSRVALPAFNAGGTEAPLGGAANGSVGFKSRLDVAHYKQGEGEGEGEGGIPPVDIVSGVSMALDEAVMPHSASRDGGAGRPARDADSDDGSTGGWQPVEVASP